MLDVSAAERIPGWMSVPELEWLAAAAKDCTCIVEIGCWKGRSTKAIATHTPGIVYAVDHWEGSGDDCAEMKHEVSSKGPDGLRDEFVRNLEPEIIAGRVIVVRAASDDAVAQLRELLDGHLADMVFIDGDHTFASVRRDILNYRCLLRDGGLLAGHDYSIAWPGVVQAVDELIPHRSVIRTGSIWHTRLNEAAPSRPVSGTAPILDLEQLAVRRLERLGDGLRSQGRLDETRDAFERLLSIDPNHVKAERIVASLAGRDAAVPSGGRGLCSAPFVRLPEFLPRPLRDRLLEAIHVNAHRFEPANVVWVDDVGDERREIDSAYRRGEFLRGCFRYFDEDIGRTFRERLAASFPMITSRLQVPLKAFHLTEMHALVYRDGDFFRAHRDTKTRDDRRITLLYYLFDAPRRFTGGELVLYDSEVHLDALNNPDSGFHPSLCTRLPCTDNQLVCFPSEYYHEALAVTGIGGDTRAARMAINGWFLATEPGQDPPDTL